MSPRQKEEKMSAKKEKHPVYRLVLLIFILMLALGTALLIFGPHQDAGRNEMAPFFTQA